MYLDQLRGPSQPTCPYIIHTHHSLYIVNGMHMAWIFWFANYPVPINRLLIVKPHVDFCFRNCEPCIMEQASMKIAGDQFNWGKLEFPPHQSVNGINLFKTMKWESTSCFKSTPQKEWELIFLKMTHEKMLLGEGEHQARVKEDDCSHFRQHVQGRLC